MDPYGSHDEHDSGEHTPVSPRRLPNDLPTSLDDRRAFDTYAGETEIYDAWQGSSQYITSPTPATALTFDLHLNTPAYDEDEVQARLQDSDSRLMEMVAAQAQHREDAADSKEDEDSVAADENLSAEQKREILQKSLNMAASNGDVARIQKLVGGSQVKHYVDVNKPDEEGAVPLIYASCFGHQEVVTALLNAGAIVDKQDRNQWSALMWAMTNRHKSIAKILLDHGADPDIRSSSGGTAYDFVQPGSDFSQYLSENGYHFGAASLGDDFYNSGFSQDRFEEEMAESEMRRRMLMQESATNLEVDLSTLGFDEQPESPVAEEDEEEFIWDRCVGDQMYVFQDSQLDPILDLIITNMTPQRSPSQKPVPANLIFLMARYAHYHMTGSLLEDLLNKSMDRINDVVERYQWDMTMLAFWISNATLLLHYLKKDSGLLPATTKCQVELAELINETFILIIRDAERRMNKILDVAILDHETIPGLDEIEFQGEWKVFKSKPKQKEEPLEKRYRPPSPKRRAQISPRNITSLLSSTLFVLDLYDVHSVITSQILAQLLYWIGAELFNRIIMTRKYLSRTKAMQIRMNISVIEDWARTNNRQPEHYENGSNTSSGEGTTDAARRHLAPIIQLLQWLQCFSSLGEDHESLVGTLMQLQRLSPTQLLHVVKSYRAEVGEKQLHKNHTKFLIQLQKGQESLVQRPITPIAPVSSGTPSTPAKSGGSKDAGTSSASGQSTPAPIPSISTPVEPDTDPPVNRHLLTLDQSMMLPFSLPTSTDMLITYGAGIGGVNRERARKYIPTVPTEILAKLNLDGDGPGAARRKDSVGTIGTIGTIGTTGTTAAGWRNGGA